MASVYRLPFPNPDTADGFHSMLGRSHPHRGVDFPQPAGALIRAVADGTVALVEHSSELGWVTVVKHSRTIPDAVKGRKPVFSGYCHQDSPRSGIAPGVTVRLGQVVGAVGRQGRNGSAAQGEHLHLTMSHELRGVFAGEVFDPLKFIARYPAVKPAPVQTWTVVKGDTLEGIAARFRTTWERLAQVNNLTDPNRIYPGQVIHL
jgi:murein DD-endopeptidase MepM/ murein hydrolase activator NlpD